LEACPPHAGTLYFSSDFTTIALVLTLLQWRILRDVDLFTKERAEVDAYENNLEGSSVTI
jgi:hypothetical protein